MTRRILLLITITVFLFSGCSNTLYRSSTVRVEVAEPQIPENKTMIDAMSMPAEYIFERNPIAVCGTVADIREIKVTYQSNGTWKEEYCTIFDFHLSEVVADNGEEIPKLVTVGYAYSSRDLPMYFQKPKEGQTYLMMAARSKDLNSKMQEGKYTDLWLLSPQTLLMPLSDHGCQVYESYLIEAVGSETGDFDLQELEALKILIREKVAEYGE